MSEQPPLPEILAVAKEAALLAGREIRQAWLQKGEVKDTKSNAVDLVTETDQRCEDLVLGLLRERYPAHAIIGEETCGSDKYELTDAPTWTVDPIDGTTNFVHRLALSCVLVAYLVGKQLQVAVTYDPMADELFWATRGGGAHLQRGAGREAPPEPCQIHVSSTSSVKKAVISMDPGYGRDEQAVARFQKPMCAFLLSGIRNIRVLGSTGLNMAYIACGRLDAGFEEGSWERNCGPKIWDFAAGRLLVEEAGGVTRDIASSTGPVSLDLMGRSFFAAATTELADELLTLKEQSQSSAGTSDAGTVATKRPATAAVKRPAAAVKRQRK